MDKNHQLDAPNNDSLKDIQQLDDRSGLAAVYPQARNEWEGVELMSGEARAQKQADEQIRINMAIRKWFPIVGLLLPMPAVLLAVMLAVAATYLDMKMARVMLLPVFAGIALWGYLSYKSIRGVYKIFYSHSIKATPYVITHIAILLIGLQGLFVISQVFHSGWLIGDILIVSGFCLLASSFLSGILLYIWTTRKVGSSFKFLLIATLALVTVAAQIIAAFL